MFVFFSAHKKHGGGCGYRNQVLYCPRKALHPGSAVLL